MEVKEKIICFFAMFFVFMLIIFSVDINDQHSRKEGSTETTSTTIQTEQKAELESITTTELPIENAVETKLVNQDNSEKIITKLSVKKTTKKKVKKKKRYKVPKGDTSFKAYTYYTCLNRRSPQWKMQKKAYTNKYGLRKIKKDYLVAMGSYYTKRLGTRFRITLSTGKKITVRVCDFKANRHTDKTNRYSRHGKKKNVIEFYVSKKLYRKARRMGDCSYVPGLRGRIVKIERLKRK